MIKKVSTLWLLRIAALLVTLASMVMFVPWLAAFAYLKPLPATIQEQLDEAMGYDLDGIVVYVGLPGREPELYAAGWKDRVLRTPADPHAFFKIGSISKLYMAVASAKLVADHRLTLDTTLVEYLPELAGRIEHAERITLEMLLAHRSGIPDWVDDPDFPWGESLAEVHQYLALVLDEPADFEPGSRYEYSNTNYLLLGAILDKTLGYPHQQYIKSAILTPLGLTHTFGRMRDVDVNKVFSGYDKNYNNDVKNLDIVAPGGSMVATAEDVGVFLRALIDGSLLDDNEQAIYSSVYLYEHTGLWPGYSSIARYHEDVDAVVIQFVNTSGGDSWLLAEIVYHRIVRILRRQYET